MSDSSEETIKALDNLNATGQDMVEQLKEINKNLAAALAALRGVDGKIFRLGDE